MASVVVVVVFLPLGWLITCNSTVCQVLVEREGQRHRDRDREMKWLLKATRQKRNWSNLKGRCVWPGWEEESRKSEGRRVSTPKAGCSLANPQSAELSCPDFSPGGQRSSAGELSGEAGNSL